MAKEKHHVFSARTTEEGLRILNDLRKERNVGWDGLVVDAVCAHYGLDKGAMAIPKQAMPEKLGKHKPKSKAKTGGKPTTEEQTGTV